LAIDTLKVSKTITRYTEDSSNIAQKDLRKTCAWLMNYTVGESVVA